MTGIASPSVASPTLFDYAEFSSEDMDHFGDASVDNGVLHLTHTAYGQAGSGWSKSHLDATKTWDTQFRVSMSNASPQGPADGVTFTLSASALTLGSNGGYLGYAGIAPSVAVEFDTFQNSDFGDLDNNHIGVDMNGRVSSGSVAVGSPGFRMSGSDFTAWVDYDPQGHILSVYADPGSQKPASPVLSTAVDLSQLADATPGFTAATGDNQESYAIRSWRMDADKPSSSRATKKKFVYVALGDSYQSGEGAGNPIIGKGYLDVYEDGSNYPANDAQGPGGRGGQTNTYGRAKDGNKCHRSLEDYAKLNRDRLEPGADVELIDVTCSGAQIEGSDYFQPPVVSNEGQSGSVSADSQVDQALARLEALHLR